MFGQGECFLRIQPTYGLRLTGPLPPPPREMAAIAKRVQERAILATPCTPGPEIGEDGALPDGFERGKNGEIYRRWKGRGVAEHHLCPHGSGRRLVHGKTCWKHRHRRLG